MILFGQEALRRSAEKKHGSRQDAEDEDEAKARDANEPAHDRGETVANPIDAAEHVAHGSACRLAALHQYRAQRRAQRQRVERRDQHRDRHRDRELAEQLATDAGNEGDGHENGKQHERDGDDRRGDLGHGLLGRLGHRELGLLLDHALDILDHDDGIIDHDADGEHQRQQRHGIGRVADASITAKVPMIETGTAISGMSVVRNLPRNRNTTMPTRTKASPKRAHDLVDGRR